MRIPGILILFTFLMVASASAVTVDLTDGRVVQGDITKKDAKSLELSEDGVAITYYADEIKDIDGQPFAQTAAPAPAAQPETAAQPGPAALPEAEGAAQDKRALILKFIDVFGTRQALTNNFELMIRQIEKEKPEEAQKIRERVKVDEIIQRLLPIYDRNFSSEDLKAFIAFYGSPEGRKLIGTIPELMKESVQESVKYMEEKFPEVKQGGS